MEHQKNFGALMSSLECGCEPGCDSDANAGVPIACTLSSADLKDRIAEIASLAHRFLRKAVRGPKGTLTLTYDGSAWADLQKIVALERECCSFLTFDLRKEDQTVQLTITAPDSAADSSEFLFGHFAPDDVTKALLRKSLL